MRPCRLSMQCRHAPCCSLGWIDVDWLAVKASWGATQGAHAGNVDVKMIEAILSRYDIRHMQL